jgi:acyl-CoA reductase-like NAD-dependent aldehyde dehydrogenase
MSKPTDTRTEPRAATPTAKSARVDLAATTTTGAAVSERAASAGDATARVPVNKAYKMYVGGAFVRSESGRYTQVTGAPWADGSADPVTVNVPRGSRKDARDAVLAAKNAQAGWSGRTAYNRGQILYRLAEMMESRREELVASLERGGCSGAEREADAAIDRAVYYAGFADKFQSLLASSNPVSGPHFGFSVPEAMGVVSIVAPARPVLLGLVSAVLPAIVSGNTVVVIASAEDPRTSVLFCECLATSDLPGGVVNLLTGDAAEIAPHLAKHREVAALEAFTSDAALRTILEREATGSVKRVRTLAPFEPAAWEADGTGQGLGWIERHLETKTIWHPVGV